MAGSSSEASGSTSTAATATAPALQHRAGSAASAASRDEVFAARLSDQSGDLNVKLRAAQDIRDEVSREGYAANSDYLRFVQLLLPVIIAQLNDGIPTSQWTCPTEVRQRLQTEGPAKHPHGVEALQSGYRHLLLEALHRLPQHEPLKAHASDLMALMLKIMENDNEEHAIMALKIIIELHRNYKDTIGSTTSAFLDLVKAVYENMQEVIATTFGDENGGGASSPDGSEDQSQSQTQTASNTAAAPSAIDAGTPGSSSAQTPGPQAQTTPGAGPLSARTFNSQQAQEQPIRKIPLGMKSLKLLAECPIAVVFLFQSYRDIVPNELRVFVPLVFGFLDMQAAPQAKAHALAAERGETFIGIIPVLNAKRPQFTDLIVAQVKTMSFVAYFLRMSAAALQQYRTNIPQLVVRLLKDCPAEGASHRKELLIAARHILQTDFRNAFVPHIDTLVDDRVLIGLGITSHEQLRPLAYSMIADLVHHVREELNIKTLSHVVHIYSCNLHDPTLAPSIQTMCSKLLLNLTENVVKTEDTEAAAVLTRSMEAFVSKVEAVADCRDDWKRWCRPAGMTAKKMRQVERKKQKAEKAKEAKKEEAEKVAGAQGKQREQDKQKKEEAAAEAADTSGDIEMEDGGRSTAAAVDEEEEDTEDPIDEVDVERSKPIAQSTAMVDTSTDLLRDTRFLLRNLIFAIKTTIHGLKHVRAPLPNSETVGRLFVAITKCMIAFDLRSDGGKEHREVMESFSSILLTIDPLVFLEVLETNMPFFLQELLKNQELLAVPQTLLADQNISQIFVGIAFRFLVSKLDDLGHGDAEFDSIILRLYKMSFMAVTIFPETNEPVLQPHLSHIIMHSLKLASKAPEPGCYYLLLRVLFRSIGGGRFELLYKEVIPLLEVLLTNLNNLLLTATDRSKRDLFVELCLTVPVRLSVLLPFLSHLMKPLVLSLQAGPDLVSQGLRTLELCVDNLTPEFLNPLLAPIQQEMNTALWRLLRPLPFNHHHAHTTVRILGKIGGRNRKNLGPPAMNWKSVTDEATAPLSFDGKKKDIPIANIVDLGLRMIKRGDLHYRRNAYAVLKHASVVFVKETLATGEQESTFADIMRGLFEACRIEEFQEDATRYLRNLALFIFSTEIARQLPEDAVNKLSLPLSSAFLDGMVESLACVQHSDVNRLSDQIVDILQDLVQHCKEKPPTRDDLPATLLHQFAMRLGSLCYDHSWQRKSGGALGIKLLVRRLELGHFWLVQHEGEFLRALVFMLKDMPTDAPGNVQDVIDTALHTIRLCHSPEHAAENQEEREKAQKYAIGFLIVELASQVEFVRTTAQAALKLMAELTGSTMEAMIGPVKGRLFSPIFTKPLRALAFPMQIGHMDAIAFCMTVDPPLLKLDTDKDTPEGAPPRDIENPLERLLTEALGIADADDAALIGPKPSHHASSTQLTKLRVVCVRLLSAAMSSSDFLVARHTNMRNKILQVYFKLLYAKSSEVVEAAYECLKVPVQQGKLPKDLLQTGLRPVLVNLGDHKRLTVDSLQGLARLLELLPNYFKVEIGQKLLDHFRALADPNILPMAALTPQSENGTMNVMASIINVFHLLPYPGAGGFLQDVCTAVVEVERRLKKATTSPFTKPLAKFVSRYASDAATLFSSQLREEAWSTTLRALILSEDGKAFRDHIAENATAFFAPSFAEDSVGTPAALHSVKAIRALITIRPSWVVENDDVINRLVSRWTSATRRQRLSAEGEVHLAQVKEDAVFVPIFISYLEQTESALGLDLLFRMTDAFIYRSPADPSALARFLFKHVAQSKDIAFRQTILRRFIDFFANDGILPSHKTMALRYIVNPLLLVAFSRGEVDSAISDPDYMNLVHGRIWQPWLHNDNEAGVSEDALRIEGLYMATLIVKHRWQVLTDCRKDIIKLGWSYMKTPDPTTKTAAHCLIAQFLAVYDSKPKILMPIYTTLLRSHQVEARNLVKEALNVLVPQLPVRCPSMDSGLHPWIRATRHIMTEDGHSSMSQLTHIFQVIIRFPDVFYERRDLFVPSMVTSLPKLCLLSTATPESRSLCIDLIELMVNWDKQRIKAAKEEEAGKMDIDGVAGDEDAGSRPNPSPKRMSSIAPSTTSQSSGFHAFTVPSPMRESILNGALIRFIASTPEPVARGGIVKRSLDLLKYLFTVWPDVNVKFAFLQRVLAETDTQDQHLVMICNTVDVLSTVISVKSDDWIKENVAALHRVAERGMSQQDARLHVAYKPVLQRILSILPSAADRDLPGNEALKALEEWANNSINDGLRAMTNLHSTIVFMEAWAAASPNAVDTFMAPLVRVITTLAKEHLNTAGAPSHAHEVHLRLLRSCLELCKNRMAHTGDGRRWVLSALCTLVEKSPNVDFCRFILDLAAHWVLVDHKEAFPTNKEKATLLGKMMVFENRPEETLLREFLQVILKVYSDPQLARSEYTVRLEQPFLLGCRNRDPGLRCKFMEVFDQAIVHTLHGRLNYIFGIQNWESLADTNWMHQALDLLLGAIEKDTPLLSESAAEPVSQAGETFKLELQKFTAGGFIDAARKLLYSDPDTTHSAWVAIFKEAWTCLPRNSQIETTRYLIGLLTKEYHLQNVDRRPNVIQTLLAGALACSPSLALPPHLVRYLGKTYNVHHTAIELLQNVVEEHRDEDAIRESGLDALAETYAELAEEDPLYGLWRRRAFFSETNISLSFEQAGLWNQAQQMYEAAQLKARSGTLPFTESEYTLWEDHWIACAEKLQQWDILTDLAKTEGNNDLLLECAWRLQDWANDKVQIQDAIQNMLPVPTPRKRVFEALMLLVRSQTGEQVNPADFQRVCDEGIQFSLRKWYHLPEIVGDSHIPLLHIFQQWVELQEAAKQIFVSLASTDASNLDQRSQEMKATLQTWRDRLPNLWDNVNIWSDLVAWRQHIFGAINRAYMPLIPAAGPNAAAASANSHAYRGFHETAWIINRFAHVARKHHLTEVCISSLTKIYTLPNIEIQEAFLKLREQAKSHYQNPMELSSGLEVINNTNLGYFNPQQKSEFFTLKGMFLARLGMNEEAHTVFTQAVTLDMTFPKVWAEYGRYHDRLFKADPNDLQRATHAVACYLQAAGLYKSGKVRKLLVRILWLLSLDDATGTVSKAFDAYTGELPVWYWITFAPQLIGALANREARYARIILMQVAKKYPQGLFFHLRVARAEYAIAQKQQKDAEARAAAAAAKNAAANGAAPQASQVSADGTEPPPASNGSAEQNGQSQDSDQKSQQPLQPAKERTALEYVEDIASSLKTAFPLLALSVELVCDQISTRFKAVPDEDIFRLITALLQDGMQQYINRSTVPNDEGLLPKSTQSNIGRFAGNLPSHLKDAFHQDFITTSPNLRQYVQRLQVWRNRYEQILDRKPKRHPLENLSHWLVEYKYQTFDEIEVPGQYLKSEDNNRSFVKISYFAPKVEVGRFGGAFTRRLTMVGHDGSNHTFAVQHPLPRGSRREEKMNQFFRMLNGPLHNRVESRKRNLQFQLPAIVHVGQLCRLVESDSSVTTLQDIYERYCEDVGMDKDDPIMAYVEKLRDIMATLPKTQPNNSDLLPMAAKLDVYIEIATKMFPDTILRDYFIRSTSSASDLWHTRKQVTLDLAAFFFQTYILCIGRRLPNKLLFSRAGGQFHTTELVPDQANKKPEFTNGEAVPFRLTPNIQTFVTPIGIEGLLVTSVATIARALTESEYDLEHKLAIFVSDEMQFWYSSRKMARPTDQQLRGMTLSQVSEVVRRATLLSCKMEREKLPIGGTVVNQSVLDLVLYATNPLRLASLDVSAMPWL